MRSFNRCEVENMSLLGCGEERQGSGKKRQGGGGVEMSTEEKCLYEYNLTLSFEETMGRWGLTNTPNVNIDVLLTS